MRRATRKSVSVRELRASAGRILRLVRDKHETVDLTYRGQVIARIVPILVRSKAIKVPSTTWTKVDHLAGEIGRHWNPRDMSAAEAVSEGRQG